MFDIALGSAMLLLFSPLVLVIALAVFVTDPGPIIFGHRHVGMRGGTSKGLKFRSMVVDAEARLQSLLSSDPMMPASWDRDHKPNDPRITLIGRFVRLFSLDELPELLNVLGGE